MRHARSSPLVLAAAIALGGCIGGGGSGSGLPGGDAEAAAANLQACDVYGPGEVRSIQDAPLAWLDACYLGCLADADCDELQQLVCEYDSAGKLDECRTACALEGSFTCPSGAVVASSAVCDGVDNCVGGEDEQDCPEPTSDCFPDPYWICDGSDDCEDGSDEMGCDYTYCDDGNLVPPAYFCDGWEWCQDGSDEDGCAQRRC